MKPMKIIALHLFGQEQPHYISAFKDAVNDEIHPKIEMSSDRKQAIQFCPSIVRDMQNLVRISVAHYIAKSMPPGYIENPLFKTVVGVMIEDSENKHSDHIIMRLKYIVRRDNNMQTVAFRDRVDSMLKGSTIENNYKRMLVESPNQALKGWWKDFTQFLSGMPPHFLNGLNLADQFTFHYDIIEIKDDGSFWNTGYDKFALMSDIIKE